MPTIWKNTRRPFAKIQPETCTAEPKARKLLNVIVYDRNSRVGDKLTLYHLIETTDIGDWKMSAFEAAGTYAVSQGWLVIEDNSLRSSPAGSAAA